MMSASPTPRAISSAAPATPRLRHGSSVLLVDYSADNREPYAWCLERSGYRVVEAGAGLEALALLECNCADLIITELALPDLDGFELCRRVRGRPDSPPVPVVALTALPLTRDRVRQVREAGIQVLLAKPCLPFTLLDCVRRVLDRGRKRL